MSDPNAHAAADPRDMVMIHGMIHRALDEVSVLVSTAAPDDSAAVGRIADHAALICKLVHLHHEGEDELLWPLLAERCPGQQPLLEKMQDQHRATAATLARTLEALDEWRAEPDAATGDAFVGSVTTLAGVLRTHCDDEEDQILPLIPANVSPDEWAQLPGHAMAQMDGRQNSIVLGLMLEPLTGEERVEVLANLPAPVAAGWADGGRDGFRSYIDGVRALGHEVLDASVGRPAPELREPPMG